MEAQQALADLTEISSQIQAAVVFDDAGKVAASTLDESRADALAQGARRLLEQAQQVTRPEGGPLIQLEAATQEGSVFVVAEGTTRIAATTPPEPTVGLVFYDLKSALRSIAAKPARAPRKRATPAKKATAAKPAASTAKKPAPRRKKPDAP
jgi:predicted regulator of Ras-like GTPase activity (Roadblock/LC7/MglB family)